jgi:hypothetical protein
MTLRVLVGGLAIMLHASLALAAEYRIVPQESVLAVVTHKAGFASGLAHNHFVTAGRYEARLELDPASSTTARFTVGLHAEDLVVDDPKLEQAWHGRLDELGILSEPFGDPSDEDRAKIRRTMLSAKQLDAETFPEISASVVWIRRDAADSHAEGFPYVVRLAMKIHGQRVEREFAARYALADGKLLVEAFGSYRFSEFGIRPYSSFLGAVKNRDEFHVFVYLVATPPSPAAESGP